MNVKQVAEYFGISESTLRRRLRDRKNGEGTFPTPIFGFNKVARWRRYDIENWYETGPDIITVESPTQINRKVESAKKSLTTLGIKVPKTENKSNSITNKKNNR